MRVEFGCFIADIGMGIEEMLLLMPPKVVRRTEKRCGSCDMIAPQLLFTDLIL